MTVDRDGRIHLVLDEHNNVEGLRRLRHKLQGMLGDLDMHPHRLLDHSVYLHKGMPIGATAHQAGTVRFGTDPAARHWTGPAGRTTSTTSTWSTRAFPSIGAVNPSLTAIANALRVGDHLAGRLG